MSLPTMTPSVSVTSPLSKLNLITVEPVMFLYQLVVFTQFGVLQDLVTEKVCLNSQYKHMCHDLSNASLDYVQTESSHWIRYNNIAGLLPATISAIYMGSWCSVYGAKMPMLLATLGSMISNMATIVVSVYKEMDVAYLLIGQFIGGVFGGGIVLTMSVMSYISVISSLKSRTTRIGILTAMLSLGATVGPFIGGILLKTTNHAIVFLFLLSVNVVTVIYILVRVKNVIPVDDEESVSPEMPPVTCKRLFSLDNFISTVTTCFKKREHNQRKYIILIILSTAMYFFGVGGEADVTYLFVKDKPLKWEYITFSYFSGLSQGFRSIALVVALPVFKQHFEFLDTTTGLIGILSCALSALFLAFSYTPAMVFCVPLISAVQGFFVASMRSLLSKLVAKNEHGKMFAFVAVMENFCYLMASLVFNSIYPFTRPFFNGFVFVLVAILELFPMATVICLRTPLRPFSMLRSTVTSYESVSKE